MLQNIGNDEDDVTMVVWSNRHRTIPKCDILHCVAAGGYSKGTVGLSHAVMSVSIQYFRRCRLYSMLLAEGNLRNKRFVFLNVLHFSFPLGVTEHWNRTHNSQTCTIQHESGTANNKHVIKLC